MAVSVLGHVLAAATQSATTPDGYSSWSDAMYESVTTEGRRGRMSALNALLAADDAVYDTSTLVDLADRLEDLPYDGAGASSTPSSIYGWYDDEYGFAYNESLALQGYSMDPLYGVTMAMGNNPEAAFQYLNPDGQMNDGQWVPGEQTEKRWKLLTDRDWDSDVGLDGFTAAMAGASSMRGSDNAETAAAATWNVARSMEFAVDDVPFKEYTETMKENLSVVLANTADQGINIATGGSPDGLGLSGDQDPASTYTTLIYRVIDNENAAVTVSSSFTNAVMDRYPDITDVNQLEHKYQEVGSVYGYLNAIGSERLTDLEDASAAEQKAAKDAMGTALSVMATVMGAGGVSGLAWDVGKTIVQPIVVDELVPGDLPDIDDPITTTRTTLQSQAYAEAVNQGLFTDPGAFDPGYLQDEHSGEPYSWYTGNEDGASFNLDNPPTSEQNDQIHNWATDIKPDHDPDNIVTDTNGAISSGISDGQSRILGEDGEGGESGGIEIKKD
ncbi:DUF6571 family protein [Actinomyces sp. MRS3W]|uniref:DUF6571 family protein n=1 Tax=Actinomyces sp. MRS3W TaxID=2800796 RepID=UPI0028FD49B6|nr:DUF6571 family protein [Actinomyces sp. MRS3W]MDU0348683.1 DUF6571 family protein [Actinomyces sp. MRS3W]